MSNYKYRAMSQQGVLQRGVMGASDFSDLHARLKDLGLLLIEAKETREPVASTPRDRKVKPQVILEFVTHMASLAQAGVPTFSALTSLSQEATETPFGRVLHEMWRTVETGVPLHTAMSQHPKVFPQLVINLVQAGEESGTLPDTFRELQRYLQWVERLKGEVRQAVIYPLTILSAVIALFVLMFTFVIPRFAPILESLNLPLPLITVVVLGLSRTLESTWWMWGTIAVGGPIAVWVLKTRVSAFEERWDAWMLRLPVIGPLKSMLALSRVMHNFGVMSRAGIPVLQALNLCQRLAGNRVFARALGQVEQAVSEGATISNALRQHAVFPPILVQMVSVGEAAGRLDHTMIHVADYYNEEIPRRVKALFSILEPVVTVGLIVTVGLVALSIFLPMMSLMGGMR